MKQILKTLLIIVLSYLSVAFITFELNPALWEADYRLLMLIVFIILILVISFIERLKKCLNEKDTTNDEIIETYYLKK